MPKTRVVPRPTPVDDVPIWDELLTELGDPRPYEPTAIGTVVVTDEPCVDHDAFDDLVTNLNDEVERFWHVADELTFEANAAFDEVYPWPEVVDHDATVVGPALAQLDVEATVVLPSWPIRDAEATS